VTYAPVNCSGKPPVINNPSEAKDDSASTIQNVAVEINVLANDTDADKDALTIVVFTQPKQGVVTRKDEVLIYQSKRGFKGTDKFTYTVSDRHGGTDKAIVSVTVEAKPVAVKVKVDKVKWDNKRKELLVQGKGTLKNASVKILNAATGQSIDQGNTNKKGKWKVKIKQLSEVPCKVRVEISKDTQTGAVEKMVRKAPKDCK